MRKMFAILCMVSLILATLSFNTVRAADWYVDAALGADNMACGIASGASACKTITYTIANRAASGDTIHVATGLYNSFLGETFPIAMPALFTSLTLVGAGGGTTVIDATGTGQDAIYITGARIFNLSGFAVMGGGASKAGLYLYNASGNPSTGMITNNMFSVNTYGIRIYGPSTVTVSNNIILNNVTNGIWVVYSSNPTINANWITANGFNGIFVQGASPLITNNLITTNTEWGIRNQNTTGNSSTIFNNTLASNNANGGTYGGGIELVAGNPTLTNNIIASNTTCGITWTAGTPTITYNDVWGSATNYCGMTDPTGSNGNISADPQFVGGGNYHLTCSPLNPAVDTGTGTGAPLSDIEGTARPRGPAVDMGAYETTCETAPSLTVTAATSCPNQMTLTWQGAVPPSSRTIQSYNVYRGTSPGVDTTGAAYATGASSPYTDTSVSSSAGVTYYYKVRAVYDDGSKGPESNESSGTTLDCVGTAPVLNAADSTGCPNSIVLTWTAATPPYGRTISGYNVYRSWTSPVPTVTPYASLGNVLTYTDTGVSTSAMTYYYIVRAVFSDATYLDSNQDYAATVQCTFPLTASVVGNGSVTSNPAGIDCGSDCMEIYNYGTIVTLTAAPDGTSQFVGWSGACTGTALTCTLTIDAAKNVTATFGLKQAGKKVQLPYLLPMALNNMARAKTLLTQANELLSQVKAKGKDTGTCETLIREATELLTKANTVRTNPIYANNLALQAIAKLKDAIDCLKALTG